MGTSYDSKTFVFAGYLIISVLGTVCFLSSLSGDFVFDDTEVIINNSDVLPTTPIKDLFENDYWGTKLISNLSHKSYRPLTVLSFRLNYALGGLRAWYFHAINLILHVLVSNIVWSVFEKIVGEHRTFTSFLGALLFAVHPVHSEAVCGIVGRADLLCALFFFLSFLSFTKSDVNGSVGWIWLTVSLLLAGISMLCKEQGITVIGVCFVYDVLFINKISINKLLKLNYKILDRRKLFLRQFILFSAAGVYVWIRCAIMDFQSPSFQRVDNPASYEEDWIVRTLSYNYIFSLNSWILLCPEWLCFDWSMGCVKVVTLKDARVFIVFLFWTILGFILWKCLKNKNPGRQREMLMSIALIIIPFLPASNLLFRVGFVLAERVLYIPSAGFCLLVACGVELLSHKFPTNRSDVNFGFSLLIMVFLIRSHERSMEWRTEGSLFNSGASVCPDNAKVHYNIGKNAVDSGDINKAVLEYKEAIRLFPEYDQALNNLANILKNKGELNEAEALLRRALKIRQEFPAAWMNLGIVLANKRQFSESEKCYFNALKYRKQYPDCYYNLGNLYLEQNRLVEAEKAWHIAVKLKPNFVIAWNNIIILNDNNGNHTQAVLIAQQALEIVKNEPSIHFNLANALGKLGEFEKSEKHFLTALKLNSTNAHYFVNLGVLYHRWKKYRRAEECYKKALKINSNLKSAKENYELLKKTLKK